MDTAPPFFPVRAGCSGDPPPEPWPGPPPPDPPEPDGCVYFRRDSSVAWVVLNGAWEPLGEGALDGHRLSVRLPTPLLDEVTITIVAVAPPGD